MVCFFFFCLGGFEPMHDLRPLCGRREWVSKRKQHSALFSCRDTPQSKEEWSEASFARITTMRLGRAMKNPTPATKKKSRASGFFFLYFSLFSFHSSLFSKSPARLFQRRDKSKKKSRVSGFFFLYSSLFSFHSSLFSKSPTRLFQRRDKREERKEKVAFLPLVEKHWFLVKNVV